jgi:hypothetical protein
VATFNKGIHQCVGREVGLTFVTSLGDEVFGSCCTRGLWLSLILYWQVYNVIGLVVCVCVCVLFFNNKLFFIMVGLEFLFDITCVFLVVAAKFEK